MLFSTVIDELERRGLEEARKLLKEHEPLQIPDIPPQRIVDKNIDLIVDLEGVKISKASDFTIDHIETNLPGLWVTIAVTVPNVHLEGSYDVDGIVDQKEITGSGNSTIDIISFEQKITIYLDMVEHALHIKQLDLDYSLAGLNIDLNGLQIEGMTKSQVQFLLNYEFFQYLATNKDDVCDFLSRQAMFAANEVLEGRTLLEIYDWLKHFIHQ